MSGSKVKKPLLAVTCVLFLAGSASAWDRLRSANPVTIDRAVADFRSQAGKPTSGPSPSAPLPHDPDPTGSAGSMSPQAAAGQDQRQAGVTLPQGGSRGEGARRLPEAGVYVYKTDGHEETDAATGSRHDYPTETSIRILHSACGFDSRWSVLEERWEDISYCLEEGGHSFRRFTTYHEFFSKGDTQTLECPSASFVYRYRPHGGRSWAFACQAPDSAARSDAREVGLETIDVGGKAVECVRVLTELELTGRNRGTQRQERWLSTDTGLVIKMTSQADMQTDSPFGTVRYRESYTLQLASLTPLR